MAKNKKGVKEYFELGNMSASLILKNLPFVLFVSFLAMIYIANAHYSEKKIRQIQALQKEITQIRWHYMAIQSDLMVKSKRSEVEKSVTSLNLKMPKGTPKKIVIPKRKN